MKKIILVWYSLLPTLCLALLLNPVYAQEVKKYAKNVETQGATSVQVQLSQSAGTLKISGGASQLMEGLFAMTNQEWKPQITYNNENKKGKLVVQQPDSEHLNMEDNDRNDWQVRLSNTIPLDMKLTVGAGQSTIDLRNTALKKLHLKAGAGDFSVNLAGTSVPELDIDAGVGKMTIDLTGKWANSLEAEIDGGIGEVTLKLPRKTGVRVQINGLGSMETAGFKKQDGYYVNESYKKTDQTLDIEINGGLGRVSLELEK